MENMRNKIGLLKKNVYVMRILTLMSGTLIAQAILLAFMPVLTRLYTPAEFGEYSLFFSMASTIGLISSLKYDQALMLPESDNNAHALLWLSVSSTLAVAFMVFLGLYLFEPLILEYFNEIEHFMWLIPVGVLTIGLLQIFNAYSSRLQYYKEIAAVRVVNAISVVSIQSSAKFFLKLDGLIAGKLVADLVSILLLLRVHLKNKTIRIGSVPFKRMYLNARRYDQFPKFQSIAVLVNALSQNMPIILLGMFYSMEIAGFYALAVRALKAPVGLVGASTKEVFYQTASKRYAEDKEILNLYLKTTIGLAKIFLLPFLMVLFFGDMLFEYVFGSEWHTAGIIAQVLVLWTLFLFVNSPTISTFSILGLQKVSLVIEIGSIFLRFISIYLGYYIFNSYLLSIIFYVCSSVFVNVYAILFIYHKLKGLYGQ